MSDDKQGRKQAAERLRELRNQIDALDERIQDLIARRAQLAQEIATAKHRNGAANFYNPEREVEVLRKAVKRNRGPLSNEDVARLFREIMSLCLALESRLKVAFLGPEGTFTHAAALKHFGHAVEVVPAGSIAEVFREVESDAVHFGVVPIENSTEGMVNHTLDMFMDSPLKICGEVELRIHHHLLAKGKGLRAIKKILSHHQSLAQCREWLDTHLPAVERVPVASNAEAARQAARNKNYAAIAGGSAAELYGLKVLAANIEDEPDNTTRFLIVGKLDVQPSGDDKTSLLLSGHNRPGSLAALLAPLSRHGINMTRIESRPSRKGVWEYVFFFDLDGHREDEKLRAALAELEREAAFVKLLGSYPKAVL
ncbi:MAG: chorismate mutase [Candidatus Muproteobacteria bacterium RBG_16_64_11]|uniref:Bifunctional chorismate mutase/prephenate dehydratase n=1 Tax=Candidatus Muproteobacteria bacterium RBG_16_64_11 TaxID=1817758 RepID=A0A1F6TB10_9PROT|nr:MAG: chorismate mutase [Candidatus Muproteobacteria bacterium RBG_16_64_11]